jgi:O-antigen/teichoic acid export membrane protein
MSWAVALKDEVAARGYMQGANRIAFLIIAPSCTLLFLDAEAILSCLFSSAYAAGQIYLRFQLGAFGMLVFLEIFLNALMAGGKYGQSVGILLLLIPVQLLFNLILIPQFGAVGAAASSVITFSIGAAFATVVAVRRFGSLIRLSTLAKGTAATVLVGVVGSQIVLPGVLIMLKLLLLVLLYGLLLAMLGELTSQDFKIVERSSIVTGD